MYSNNCVLGVSTSFKVNDFRFFKYVSCCMSSAKIKY